MSNKMQVFTIAFECISTNAPADRCIMTFLEKVQGIISRDPTKVVRQITNDKNIRVTPYFRSYIQDVIQQDYVVVQFGKLKSDKPYVMDSTNSTLKELPEDSFDVNFLAYHKRHKVALLTTTKLGPSYRVVGDYLTTYLTDDEREKFQICLRPISTSNDLGKVREAEVVKSINITLNLNKSLDNIFTGQTSLKNQSLLQGFRYILGSAKVAKEDMNSNTYTFSLGMGKYAGRKTSLSLEAVQLLLFDFINWNDDSIQEVEVKYGDGTRALETARLRNHDFNSWVKFSWNPKKRMAGGFIVDNMDDVLRDNITRFRKQIDEYFRNQIQIGDEYEIQEEFPRRKSTV